jgi:excisionase family DNA binding protein
MRAKQRFARQIPKYFTRPPRTATQIGKTIACAQARTRALRPRKQFQPARRCWTVRGGDFGRRGRWCTPWALADSREGWSALEKRAKNAVRAIARGDACHIERWLLSASETRTPLPPVLREPIMAATKSEIEAARAFGEAFLNLLLAHEDGAGRRAQESSLTQGLPSVRGSGGHPSTPGADPWKAVPAMLLTSSEAAQVLRISSRTVLRLTAPRGPLTSTRIGSSVRYAIEDLQAMVAEMRSTTNATPRSKDVR